MTGKRGDEAAPGAPAKAGIRAELRALRVELARLNGHGFIRLHESLPLLLAFNFATRLGKMFMHLDFIFIWSQRVYLLVLEFGTRIPQV